MKTLFLYKSFHIVLYRLTLKLFRSEIRCVAIGCNSSQFTTLASPIPITEIRFELVSMPGQTQSEIGDRNSGKTVLCEDLSDNDCIHSTTVSQEI